MPPALGAPGASVTLPGAGDSPRGLGGRAGLSARAVPNRSEVGEGDGGPRRHRRLSRARAELPWQWSVTGPWLPVVSMTALASMPAIAPAGLCEKASAVVGAARRKKHCSSEGLGYTTRE